MSQASTERLFERRIDSSEGEKRSRPHTSNGLATLGELKEGAGCHDAWPLPCVSRVDLIAGLATRFALLPNSKGNGCRKVARAVILPDNLRR